MKESRFIERVLMDVTTRCNLACIMCGVPRETEKYDMPLKLYKKIAGQVFPYAKELWLSCGREAFAAEGFAGMLAFTGQFDIPKTSIITNGTLLSRDNICGMIDAGLERLFISMDAAGKEAYESIRKGADFEKVLANIDSVRKIRKEKGKETPRMIFSVTLMKKNIEELPGIVALASRYGIEEISVKPMRIIVKGMESESLAGNPGRLTGSILKAREIAESSGIHLGCTPDMDSYAPGSPGPSGSGPAHDREDVCLEDAFPIMVIHPDGRVDPCTVWRGDPVGDFKYQDFEEIWNSGIYSGLRANNMSKTMKDAGCDCPFRRADNINFEKGKNLCRELEKIVVKAEEHARRGDRDTVKDLLGKAMEYEPMEEKAKAYVLTGRLLISAGEYEKALGYFKNALMSFKYDDDRFWALYYIGYLYGRHGAGKRDETAGHLENALRIYPQSPVFYVMLSGIRIEEGLLKDAGRLLRAAFRMDPGSSMVNRGLAVYHSARRRYWRAKRFYNAAIKKAARGSEDYALACSGMAEFYRKNGKYEKADKMLGKAAEQENPV